MAIDDAFLARVRIEPLDRARHDRAGFSSGEQRVDTYLKTRAAGLMDADGTRTWVACLDDTCDIIGFYSLNAHAIDASALPAASRRKLPTSHPIPATFLSYIGTAAAFQNRGLGRLLLADAFRKSVVAADHVGSAFIVLDALSEDAARLYRRLGFVDLEGTAGRMIIGMRAVRAAIHAAAL